MSAADRLRTVLEQPGVAVMPSCWDALSARLIERAGFDVAFMSGFALAASVGLPDTGLLSYGEVIDRGRSICDAVDIPVIGDADTGYGNALNVKRTVAGFASAGFACAMIEDQVAPKRCGHTRGKQIVSRGEAFARVQAAVDARDDGADILVMARTDARATDGLDEAIARAQQFRRIGADITFLEAPLNEDEMRAYCDAVDGPKVANLVEGGDTPVLAPSELQALGYKLSMNPLTLQMAAVRAIEQALATLAAGDRPTELASFAELQDIAGFPEYFAAEQRYAADAD